MGLAHRQGDRDSPPSQPHADDLPPILKGFGAAPPLVTDINLSLDDRFLYVSCLGTGELKQFGHVRSVQPDRDRLGENRRHGPSSAALRRVRMSC